MRAPKLLTAAMALSLCAPAWAGRPIVPAGQPPPTPETETEDEPAKAPEPVKAAQPSPPAEAPRVKPAAQSVSAAPPAAPKIIENPAEAIYRQKVADRLFTLHVRPGAPRPGDLVDLEVEMVRLLDPPDPVEGDRKPIEDAEAVATLSKPGLPGPLRVLRSLGVPGDYGMHATLADAGVYSLAISRRSGKPGLDMTFPLGIGVPTPARPDDVTTRASAGRSPVRSARSPNAAADAPGLDAVMIDLGSRVAALEGQLSDPHGGDVASIEKALLDLSGKVAGQVPRRHMNRRAEFDQQAAQLATALEGLGSDREKIRSRLVEIEQDRCLRCHAEFDYDVADDVSAWPNFTPATPRGKE